MRYSFSILRDLLRKHIRPIVFIAGGIVIIVIAIILISWGYRPEDDSWFLWNTQDISVTENNRLSQKLKTIHVPEPGETSWNEDEWVLAIPTLSIQASPETHSKFRSFDLHLSEGAFSASEIAVNKGDVVNLKVHAIDQDYTVHVSWYNLLQNIPKDTTKTLQFQAAQSGVFDYTCDACDLKNTGHLFVK